MRPAERSSWRHHPTSSSERPYAGDLRAGNYGAWVMTSPERQLPERQRSAHDPDGFVIALTALSDNTRRAYEHDAREFVEWCERGGCPDPADLDHRALRRYLAYLQTRGFPDHRPLARRHPFARISVTCAAAAYCIATLPRPSRRRAAHAACRACRGRRRPRRCSTTSSTEPAPTTQSL